jgi:hypothetical protein
MSSHAKAAVTVNRNLATASQRKAVCRLATPCVPASDPAGVVVAAKAVELRLSCGVETFTSGEQAQCFYFAGTGPRSAS